MSIGQRHINLFVGLVVLDPDPIGPIAALVVAPGQMSRHHVLGALVPFETNERDGS